LVDIVGFNGQSKKGLALSLLFVTVRICEAAAENSFVSKNDDTSCIENLN
jgi:hypothetical protein